MCHRQPAAYTLRCRPPFHRRRLPRVRVHDGGWHRYNNFLPVRVALRHRDVLRTPRAQEIGRQIWIQVQKEAKDGRQEGSVCMLVVRSVGALRQRAYSVPYVVKVSLAVEIRHLAVSVRRNAPWETPTRSTRSHYRMLG